MKNPIELNKNVAGRVSNMLFGILNIIDGLIRVISLGFLHTTLTLDYSRYSAKRYFTKMSKK